MFYLDLELISIKTSTAAKSRKFCLLVMLLHLCMKDLDPRYPVTINSRQHTYQDSLQYDRKLISTRRRGRPTTFIAIIAIVAIFAAQLATATIKDTYSSLTSVKEDEDSAKRSFTATWMKTTKPWLSLGRRREWLPAEFFVGLLQSYFHLLMLDFIDYSFYRMSNQITLETDSVESSIVPPNHLQTPTKQRQRR